MLKPALFATNRLQSESGLQVCISYTAIHAGDMFLD